MLHKHCPSATPPGKCVPHHATHLPPSSALMAQSTKWGDVIENASLCQSHGELHQGTNQEKKRILLIHDTQWMQCGHFILFWFWGFWWDLKYMLRQWCQLLRGISHPNLSELMDFYKLWWLVDDESRPVADRQFRHPAKTLIQEEWWKVQQRINPVTVTFITVETHKSLIQIFHLRIRFTVV